MRARARPHCSRVSEGFWGGLDVALAGFRHPAAVGRDLVWDPARAPEIIERHRDAITDLSRRELVARFEALYKSEVAPLLPGLPRSVIHNDANDYNVLVGPPAERPEDRPVTGLLDFGDMVETWTVCELAVAVAYGVFGQPEALAAAERVVAGYHSQRPLSEAELDAVWILAAMRLCTSVCLSAHRRTADPDNPYLLVSEAPAWEALGRMAEIHPRFARAALRNACGLPPCPQTPAIEAWLREHRGEFAPVVAADLGRAVVFDLSVASPEFRTPAETLDTATMTPRLFSKMREAAHRRRDRPLRRSAAHLRRRRVRRRKVPSRAPSTRSAAPCTSPWTSSWSPARPCTLRWPAACTPSMTTPRATTTARPSSSSTRRRARPASTRCTATWLPTVSSR